MLENIAELLQYSHPSLKRALFCKIRIVLYWTSCDTDFLFALSLSKSGKKPLWFDKLIKTVFLVLGVCRKFCWHFYKKGVNNNFLW